MSSTPIQPIALPAAGQTLATQLALASVGGPVVIAYGRHIVGGNLILQEQAVGGVPTTLFFALGEGEWDGPNQIWLNGISIDLTNTSLVHFHPGTEGENADETTPATRNQQCCSFFPTDLVPRLTFNRTAYVAFSAPQSPYSPTSGFSIVGDYNAMRVRTFDSGGSLTGYAYSDNPAWCTLDLLIRRYLWPHGLVGVDLPAAVKARIDFPSWLAWASQIAGLGTYTPQQLARWAGSVDNSIDDSVQQNTAGVAFVSATNLLEALELMLLVGSGYLIEKNGKFAGIWDGSRDSQLTLTGDFIRANSFTAGSVDLRDAANQFVFTYRNLGSGAGDPTKDFQSQTLSLDDEPTQDRVGFITQYAVDVGNSYPPQVERMAEFTRRTTLSFPRTAQLTTVADTPGLRDLVEGDAITAPRRLDYSDSLKYQIAQITNNPDGSADLQLQEFDDDTYGRNNLLDNGGIS